MFLGHEAVAFAAKRYAPATSLGTLFIAVQFLDLLLPVFLLLGIEHVRIKPGITAFNPLDLYDYPYTHSLLFTLVWSALFGLGYYVLRRDKTAACVTGICVFSHWILDAVVHRPDMPLYPGGALRIGFGLWNSIAGTLIVEISMFLVSLLVYLRTTTARGMAGHVSLWSLVVVLMVIYIGGIGSPPPSESVLAIVGLSAWLLVFWGFWIERTRSNQEVT